MFKTKITIERSWIRCLWFGTISRGMFSCSLPDKHLCSGILANSTRKVPLRQGGEPKKNFWELVTLQSKATWMSSSTQFSMWGDTIHFTSLRTHSLEHYGKHKLGADRTELFRAVRVDPLNRLKDIECERQIKVWFSFLRMWRSHQHDPQGWTAFDFPGRLGKVNSALYFDWPEVKRAIQYSSMRWNFNHFTGQSALASLSLFWGAETA